MGMHQGSTTFDEDKGWGGWVKPNLPPFIITYTRRT